ncbi:YrzE family protein, partial [Bartonella sp. CB178]|uniref:YrzE family protein n=1 Tax=Bartonella sp. CB178 TaxID=3112255 RepID=UPI00300DD102
MATHIPKNTFNNRFLKETPHKTEYPIFYTSITWSAILGGLVIMLAVSVCLSFLVAALGFGQVDLGSQSPFQWSLLSVGISSLIVTIISLASGSFVAGRFAETSGAFHGFLTWALLTLIMAIQAIFLASNAASLSAKAVLKGGSAIQQTVTNDVFPALLKLSDEDFETFVRGKNGNGADFDKLRTLIDENEIPALNPDRLKQTYKAALKDIGSAMEDFKDDPSHYQAHLKNLGERLSGHVQAITEKIDRDDVVNTLINNGMTRAAAENTTDEAIDLYQAAKAKTERAINTLEQQIDT